jgi:hypothetical protein
VESQQVHSADHAQARAAVKEFVDILPDPDDEYDLYVSVSGSVGWSGSLGQDQKLTSVDVNVSASLVDKEKAA